MRILLAATAALSLSACFGGAYDPVSSVSGKPVDDAATQPSQDVHAALVGNIRAAASQAYLAAQAGTVRDRAQAQELAIQLAGIATQVQQDAQSLDPNDPDVADAVRVSALAAEAGSEISDDLSPPDQQQCSQQCGCEGCSQVCQNVPGDVDQSALSQHIADANAAGDGCSHAGDSLDGATQPIG